MNSDYRKENIITLPHDDLRKISTRVQKIDDATLQIIENMKAAMFDWEDSRPHEVAVALAAVQIDELKRIVIIREDFDDKDNKNVIILINPEIVKYEGEITVEQEGCLSVKDIYGLVPRHSKVRVRATALDGQQIHFKSPNPFMARVLQHEIDHCKGICFVDHIAQNHDAFSVLEENGELRKISFEEVQKMGILPE